MIAKKADQLRGTTLHPESSVRAGSNDYFSIVFARSNVTATTVVGYIEDALQQLYDRGARKCVFHSHCTC